MAFAHPIVLLSNASATGDPIVWPGGIGVVDVCGTFSGATVTLKMLGSDGSTYQTVGAYTTFTAAGAGGFGPLPQGATLKMFVTGGPPSGLYATAGRV